MPSVPTMTALSSLVPIVNDVHVLGYHMPNDGGGGYFYWDVSSTEADNGGTIIALASSPRIGRWKRLVEGPLSVKWFGAEGDGSTDDTAAIQQALNVASDIKSRIGTVHFPGGTYRITKTLHVNGGVRLKGDGNYGNGIWPVLKLADGGSANCIDCDFSPNPAGGFEISDMLFAKASGTGGSAIYIHTVVVNGILKQPSNIILHNILVDSYDPLGATPSRFARGLYIDGSAANESDHRGVRNVYISKLRVGNCSTPESILITQGTHIVASMLQIDRGGDCSSPPQIIVEGGAGVGGETANVVLSGLIANGDLVLRHHVRNFKAVGFVGGNIMIDGTCMKVDLLANCDGKLKIDKGATGSATGTFSGGVENASESFTVRNSF